LIRENILLTLIVYIKLTAQVNMLTCKTHV